mmetsp:Transcript_66582/g.168762  ORF Transcript_66582/g.168762 Transcript_66582/m.168762 type:complete len:210 (-) Transcript_66582:33-662(-)
MGQRANEKDVVLCRPILGACSQCQRIQIQAIEQKRCLTVVFQIAGRCPKLGGRCLQEIHSLGPNKTLVEQGTPQGRSRGDAVIRRLYAIDAPICFDDLARGQSRTHSMSQDLQRCRAALKTQHPCIHESLETRCLLEVDGLHKGHGCAPMLLESQSVLSVQARQRPEKLGCGVPNRLQPSHGPLVRQALPSGCYAASPCGHGIGVTLNS